MLLTHTLHTNTFGMLIHVIPKKSITRVYVNYRRSNRIRKEDTYVVKIPWPTTLSSRMELLEMINFGTLVYKS